jgi:hypothetical protein
MLHGDVETQRMKLVELNPAPYNPRKISDEALDGLGTSLDEFGVLSLIIWNKRSGYIVGGHQRYRKLIEMGETETDVVVVDLSNQEEVALNIMLNNPEARGDYTSDVKVMLEKVEVQIGSVFNDLKLNDLFNSIKVPKERTKNGDENESNNHPFFNKDEDEEEYENDDAAIVTCPECKSKWRLSDEEVLLNNVEDSEQVDD